MNQEGSGVEQETPERVEGAVVAEDPKPVIPLVVPCDDGAKAQVFTTAKVWKILGKCLTLSDLKECRLVCKAFNRQVIEETNFRDLAVINLTLFHLIPECFGTSREKWKHISLDVTSAAMRMEAEPPKREETMRERILKETKKLAESKQQNPEHVWLIEAFESVESLKLRRDSEKLISWKKQRIHPILKRIFCYVTNLLALSMDVTLFEDAWVYNVFNEDFGHCLFNLKKLDLVRRVGPLDTDENAFPISSPAIGCANKLEVLKLSTDQYSSADLHWELRTPVQNFVRGLLERKEQLIELDISYGLSWFLQRWGTEITQFPALKRLILNEMIIDQGFAAQLIRVQPLIEDIDLRLYFNGMPDIFHALQEKSNTLKSVCMEFAVVRRWIEKDGWAFLRETHLEELKLSYWNYICWSGELISSFLMNLPPTLNKFGLVKVVAAEEPTAGIRGVNMRSLNPINLTELILRDCGNLVTDETVEYICRHFKMLRSLDLSYAGRKVTDYGFTGISDGKVEESEFSISDLKGLRYLRLVKCGTITDLTLINIRFLELIHLDLSNNCEITHGGCREVISQNPSLRKLVTNGMAAECEKAEGPPDVDYETGSRGSGKRIGRRLVWEWGYSQAKEMEDENMMSIECDDDDEVEWEEYSEDESGDVADDFYESMSD